MSVERILIVFNADGTVRGVASYAANGAAQEMTPETAAALLPHAYLLAQVQTLQSEVAEKTARIAELEAQVPATSLPETSVHKAWLRAALASAGHLPAVDAAVQQAGAVKWELWANATAIDRNDPDVVAIAAALGIDLDAVFIEARAIRAARGG